MQTCKLRSCATTLFGGMLLTFSFAAEGAEVGLNFTGLVTAALGGGPYSISIPSGSTLSGHFVFESNTPGEPLIAAGCTDCTTYHHKQINGLRVEFPDLTLQADEYIIQMKNDVTVSAYGTADTLTVWYPDQSSASNPQLAKSLLINGGPVTKGLFSMVLVAPSTTWPDSNLPPTIDPSVFVPTAGTGTLGDGVPLANTADVLFKPQTVAAFPHSMSDHDLDGDIDGHDYLIWQRNVASNTGDGDANSDLMVDGIDLQMWQAEYGNAVSDAVAVPEPSVIALVVGACLLSVLRR